MANLRELFDNIVQMENLNGVPLAYGKMYVYALGRTRLMDTWSDVDGSSLNTNPIILDNAGQCHCYVSDAFDYTIVVCDAYDNEIFSLDKYLYSEGSHSHADVAMAPSESIAVSSYQVGETTVYVPYLTGDVGKVYTGIDPVNVDNVNDTISVSHVGLGLQDPLYFVEDSETACIIGCSAQAEIPSATSGKWEDAADTVIANSAQWADGASYEAGSYVDITDNTISVTGLQPSGDYADSTALDTKLDTTAFSDVSGSFITAVDIPESANWNSTYETVSTNSAGWTSTPQIPVTGINGIKISESGDLVVFEVSADYATESFVNGAVDSAVSGKLDSATYAAQSGNFYLTSNPAGYITGVPSSYLQNSDLTIVDNKITEISGIELSAGDEFPQSATEAIEVVTANSGDWNTVTAKLDKADSGNFYPMNGNPSGFLTAETDWTNEIANAYREATAWTDSQGYLTAETDWTNTITAASSYAYEQATAAIPQPQDLSYISGKVDDLSLDKLDYTAFSTVSGDFITALPADMATTGDINDLAQSISETYQPKGDYLTTADSANFYTTANESGFITAVPAGYATENWVTSQGYLTAETDWTDTITAASANAYEQATAAIPAPFDPSYISAQVDNKLNSAIYAADSGNFLTAHQSLPQSANWNSTYNTVSDNSASWATVTDKLDSTAFSYVSGGFLTTAEAANFYTTANESGFITAHQSLPESANWNAAYTEVSTNSADWNSAAGMNELPVSAGEGIDIQNIDGNIVFSCTGGSVPEGVLVESGLEYNAVNEISGYSGSAFAQYGAEKQWLQHDDTLLHVANSAQYALGVNVSAVAQLMGIDQTVLYSGTATNTGSLNESVENFDTIKVNYMTDDGMQGVSEFMPSYTKEITLNSMYVAQNSSIWFKATNYTFSANTSFSSYPYQLFKANNGITAAWSNNTSNTNFRITRVIGIGRKA